MNRDVEKLEEKIKGLEESIKEFENNHTKQVNNLIELFSDVIDIIKNREIKEDIKVEEKEQPIQKVEDVEEELPLFDNIKVVNNEFYGKNPKEILNYIMNNIKEEQQETSKEIEKEAEPINFEELKIEENKPKVKQRPIINFEEFKMEEFKPQATNEKLYKIEKAFSPVKVWIDTFKTTDKYLDVKEIISSYGVMGDINSSETSNNKVSLGSIIKLKENSKLFTSQNLNIELGTLEEKGYDKETPMMIMSINYVDDITNEKTTFDLYNCKTIEEKDSMIKAEREFVENNKSLKINNFCVASKNGKKIGWTTIDSLNNIIIDEMGLI